MRIDQLVPTFAAHDAIGNHVLQLRDALRGRGHDSEIFCENIGVEVRREARPFVEAVAAEGADRVLLYQSSTDSRMVPWIVEQAKAGTPVLSNYHNITPAPYFDRWEPRAAASMRRARDELKELAPVVGLALTDSDFNTGELLELGYAHAVTSPLLIDLEVFRRPPDPRALARLRRARQEGGRRWLFVGRLAPNKCQHDIVAAFAVYRKLADPAAHLTLVGSASAPRYETALRRMVRDLELEGCVELASGVPGPELRAYYAAADVFVCQSEHEGFCVPILEAMVAGLPVVAHAATAVPGTLGDTGVLLDDKDPLTVALTVAELLDDPRRCEQLVARARERARAWELPVTSARFLDTVEGWLARSAA
jgi:glycosyltransferase involved in cell wall biosynthesis